MFTVHKISGRPLKAKLIHPLWSRIAWIVSCWRSMRAVVRATCASDLSLRVKLRCRVWMFVSCHCKGHPQVSSVELWCTVDVHKSGLMARVSWEQSADPCCGVAVSGRSGLSFLHTPKSLSPSSTAQLRVICGPNFLGKRIILDLAIIWVILGGHVLLMCLSCVGA